MKEKSVLKKIFIILLLIILLILNCSLISNFKNNVKKYGIIDKDENTKVGFKYNLISAVDLDNNQKYITVFNNNIFGKTTSMFYIDIEGNSYKDKMPIYSENRAVVYNEENKKYGYIDCDNNQIAEYIYDKASDYKDGIAEVEIDGKHGILDLNGNQIISCNFDSIKVLSKSFFLVTQNNMKVLINDDETLVAEVSNDDKVKFFGYTDFENLPEFDLSNIVFSTDNIILNKDQKYGIYNKYGFKVTDFIYDECEAISDEDNFLVSIEGKTYIVNDSGENIYEVQKYEVSDMSRDRIKIKENDKYGVVDLENNIILNPEFDKISIPTLDNNYFSVEKDGTYGVYDINGDVVIECSTEYKSPILGNGEYFAVQKEVTGLKVLYTVIIVASCVIIIFGVIILFKKNDKKE